MSDERCNADLGPLTAQLVEQQREIDRLRAEVATLTAERDALAAEVAALKESLASVKQIARQAPELNPSNYDHDEVCELNAAMIQVWKEVQP